MREEERWEREEEKMKRERWEKKCCLFGDDFWWSTFWQIFPPLSSLLSLSSLSSLLSLSLSLLSLSLSLTSDPKLDTIRWLVSSFLFFHSSFLFFLSLSFLSLTFFLVEDDLPRLLMIHFDSERSKLASSISFPSSFPRFFSLSLSLCYIFFPYFSPSDFFHWIEFCFGSIRWTRQGGEKERHGGAAEREIREGEKERERERAKLREEERKNSREEERKNSREKERNWGRGRDNHGLDLVAHANRWPSFSLSFSLSLLRSIQFLSFATFFSYERERKDRLRKKRVYKERNRKKNRGRERERRKVRILPLSLTIHFCSCVVLHLIPGLKTFPSSRFLPTCLSLSLLSLVSLFFLFKSFSPSHS